MSQSLEQVVPERSGHVFDEKRHTRRTQIPGRVVAYLSGSIRKGRTDGRDPSTFWGEAEEQALIGAVRSATVSALNPAKTQLRRNDYYANYGCDLHLVSISDVVVVDARTEKGIGVGAEMMFAHSRGIPIVTVAPKNTNYRRDFVPDVFGEDLHNWVHPFVYGLSDFVVDSFSEAGDILELLASSGLACQVRAPTDAIEYYKTADVSLRSQP